MDDHPKAILTIYELDFLSVKNCMKLEGEAVITSKDACAYVLRSLAELPKNTDSGKLLYPDMTGIIFSSEHKADISDFAQNLLRGTEARNATAELVLNNTSTSLVMLYTLEEDVYILTAGRGSTYVKQYISNDFGIRIVARLFNESDGVVRQGAKNSLIGESLSTRQTTRSLAPFSRGWSFGDIGKEWTVSLGKEAQELLGLSISFPVKPVQAVFTARGIKIKQAMTIGDIKTIVRSLHSLKKQPTRFIVNNLVPVKNKGIDEKDLESAMIGHIVETKCGDCVQVIGDDPESYPWASSYRVTYTQGAQAQTNLLKSECPITMQDIVDELSDRGDLNEQHLKRVFHTCDLVTKCEEATSYRGKLQTSVLGTVAWEGDEFFLYNGRWHYIPIENYSIIDKRFSKLWEESKDEFCYLREKYRLSQESHVHTDTEERYNEALRVRGDILVGHKAKLRNVELADLLIKDGKRVFLVHNKTTFNGGGARDAMGQAVVASKVWGEQLATLGREGFLEKYYQKIEYQYERARCHIPVDIKTFIGWFDGNSEIVILGGFLEGLKRDSRSYYAKMLTCDAAERIPNIQWKMSFALINLA